MITGEMIMLNTLQEIMSAHEATGGHWFSPSTLEFWDSAFAARVLPTERGAYFLSRETNPSGVKMWSVRYADDSGDIGTVGEFFSHASEEEAYAAAEVARTAGVTE